MKIINFYCLRVVLMGESSRYREMKILKEIAEMLNEGTELYHVLSQVLKKLLDITGLQTGWIFFIDEKGSHQLVAHEALPPALSYEQNLRMCKGSCWCVNRYHHQKLTKATNIIECQRIEEAIEAKIGDHNGLTHHATVPLRAGKERFGLLNVGAPFKTFFKDDELALLEAVAFQIGTAIKRMKLVEHEQKTALNDERNRLARDLHDSVNQLLFSLSLTARAGIEMTKTEEMKSTFTYIQELAQDALGEMRSLIWQLRPQGLEDGLLSAFHKYGQLLGLTVHINLKGVPHFSSQVEEALWRIGQEALANCKKHAGTTIVYIDLEKNKEETILTIKDLGIGFQYQKGVQTPSLGLQSMQFRTEAIKGEFSLESNPGNGTLIQIKIPH